MESNAEREIDLLLKEGFTEREIDPKAKGRGVDSKVASMLII